MSHEPTSTAQSQGPSSTDKTAHEQPLKDITALEHVVVIMFENRSFDNILGYLHPSRHLPDGQTFEGLAGGTYWNLGPDGEKIHAHIYQGDYKDVIKSPDPDPGEEYQHVNTQLFGTIDPAENAQLTAQEMLPPYNVPAHGTIDMSGFVIDYFYNINIILDDKEQAYAKCGQIMGSFDPEMLPVLSTLARNFAVYDHWFSAVPSQTFCNRAFFHASTSSGFVTNAGAPGYKKWLHLNPATTIFNRLEEAGVPWAIYFDESQLVSITGLINFKALEPFWRTHFRSMTDFYNDVKAGTLPAYSFIEPRQLFCHNDMHPPLTFTIKGETIDPIYDTRAGEVLLHDVYSAIRDSESPTGSNAMNTTLLVTFDEHGGTYDHVPPPAAVPPQDLGDTECGFPFDRLGVRVPTIAISAHTRAGTVINEEMHHGAVIATLCRKHGLEPLTARDESARDIANAFNLSTPRPAAQWPQTQPVPVPAEPQAGPFTGTLAETPLTPPGRSMMGLLVEAYGAPGEPPPETYGGAYETVQRLGKGLFR